MIPEHVAPILEADAQAYIRRLAGWPYAELAVSADRWAERKYHFAREIWPMRDDPCPGFRDKHGVAITWTERFGQMWHEPLHAYRARLHAARQQQQASAA